MEDLTDGNIAEHSFKFINLASYVGRTYFDKFGSKSLYTMNVRTSIYTYVPLCVVKELMCFMVCGGGMEGTQGSERSDFSSTPSTHTHTHTDKVCHCYPR